MLNSLTLRQQHFLYQRKNLYTRNLYEVFQARQQQRIFTKSIHPLSPLFFAHPSPYFIQDSVVEGRLLGSPGGVIPENSAWTANYQ